MREREIERRIPRELLADGCLLCTEPSPEHCHRRLVVEYLAERWGGIEVLHLGVPAPRAKRGPAVLRA